MLLDTAWGLIGQGALRPARRVDGDPVAGGLGSSLAAPHPPHGDAPGRPEFLSTSLVISRRLREVKYGFEACQENCRSSPLAVLQYQIVRRSLLRLIQVLDHQ